MKIVSKNISFLLFITFVIIISSSCNQVKEKRLSIDRVCGKWGGAFRSNLNVEINPDSLRWSIRDKLAFTQIYQHRISGDSIFLYSENGMIDKLLLMPEKEMLICCNYKTHIDSFRIDEVVLLKKKNTEIITVEKQSQVNSAKKDIIIIPENQIGVFLIAFSQEEGNEVIIDEKGNRVFAFEEGTSVLFTQAEEDIKKLAYNNVEVYLQNNDGELKLFPMLFKGELDNDNAGGELLAIIEGFNQGSRKRLNNLVGRDIFGNAFWFNIGTEATISNIRDSIMYNGRYFTANHSGIWK